MPAFTLKTGLKSKGRTSTLRDRLRQKAQAEANAKFWKAENVGDEILGTVRKIGRGGKFDSLHYHVEREDGNVLIISAGEKGVLGGKLLGADIEVGDTLYVAFLGEKKSKAGNIYKDFSVATEKPAAEEQTPDDNHIPF